MFLREPQLPKNNRKTTVVNATVGLLAGVAPLVRRNGTLLGEAHGAHRASVRLLPRASLPSAPIVAVQAPSRRFGGEKGKTENWM